MYFGSAWYPEHWTPSRWPIDLQLMRDAGMNVVRVAEFAWSRLEPSDGVFDFDWLEEAINLAASYGLETVIGTPTAAAPAWLTQAHPEVLRLEPNGTRAIHGGRGHHNPAHPTYLRYCRRIAEELARRFGQHPQVIGWQIDNEYWPFSYDAETQAQFQAYLREQYGTLEALNTHWANVYWSQEYSDWSQIPMSTGWQNPCLITAFRRFVTQVFLRYQANQAEAIRAHADPRQWITHNFHGWFQHGDNSRLAEPLDFASWDPYVGTGHLDPVETGLKGDIVRGFKRQNFWVMETQPCTVNWAPVNNPMDRGEMRAMAWHLVGHGADALLYWQWRSALGGQEQYHGSLVGQSGQPRPHYGEAAQIGREFAQLADLLRGTTPQGDVALLWSFDDSWAVDAQKHHAAFSAAEHARAYYAPLRERGFGVDVLRPDAALDGYPLLVAPQLHMMSDELAARLDAYVAAGGHLLLGARSAMKDMHNALLPAYPPGPRLAEALGGHVEEFYALEGDVPVAGALGEGRATIFAEWLAADAPDAEVLLRYQQHSWLAGQPALVTRRHGQGRISYLGAWLDAAGMAGVIDWALQQSGLPARALVLPEGVEVCRRNAEGRSLTILINHQRTPQAVSLPAGYRDALTGDPVSAEITLDAWGVRLLTA